MGISVSVPEMATAWKGLCDFATLAFVYQTFENITTNYSTNKENNMMKNANHMRTIHSKDKGWFWFGLTVAIQVVFIVVSYLVMNISL